jgi:hypothetical protein
MLSNTRGCGLHNWKWMCSTVGSCKSRWRKGARGVAGSRGVRWLISNDAVRWMLSTTRGCGLHNWKWMCSTVGSCKSRWRQGARGVAGSRGVRWLISNDAVRWMLSTTRGCGLHNWKWMCSTVGFLGTRWRKGARGVAGSRGVRWLISNNAVRWMLSTTRGCGLHNWKWMCSTVGFLGTRWRKGARGVAGRETAELVYRFSEQRIAYIICNDKHFVITLDSITGAPSSIQAGSGANWFKVYECRRCERDFVDMIRGRRGREQFSSRPGTLFSYW